MNELFAKKHWEGEGVTFLIHFQDGTAVRQIELASTQKVLLSAEHPVQGESMLYDQAIEELELNDSDFISESEFDAVWFGSY